MADQVESQSIIDRIKAIKGVQTDKDVALLLGLTPADFFNRKKRGTLIPLIVEWALAEDRDLNELFKGLDSTCGNNVLGYSKRYTRPVYTMVSNIGPSRWLSDKPVEEIILSLREEI